MAGGPCHFVVSLSCDETIDRQTVSEARSRFEISQRRRTDASIGENSPTRRHGGGNRDGRLEMSLGEVDGTYR